MNDQLKTDEVLTEDWSNDLFSGLIYLKERSAPRHPCPHCDKILDACCGMASERDGTIPMTGSITICAYCGTLLEFAEIGYAKAAQSRLREIPGQILAAIEQTIRQPVLAR